MTRFAILVAILAVPAHAERLTVSDCAVQETTLACTVENTGDVAIPSFSYTAYAVEHGRTYPWAKVSGELEIAGGLEPSEAASFNFPLPSLPPRAVGREIAYEVTGVPAQSSVNSIEDAAKCWNRGSLSREASQISVTVKFDMERDGKVKGDSLLLHSATGGSSEATQQAYASARRAILMCEKGGYGMSGRTSTTFLVTFSPSGELMARESR